MPLPNPNRYTDRNRFISACIASAIKEGKSQRESAGMCYSMWENRK